VGKAQNKCKTTHAAYSVETEKFLFVKWITYGSSLTLAIPKQLKAKSK